MKGLIGLSSSKVLAIVLLCLVNLNLYSQPAIVYSFGRTHLAPISKVGMQFALGQSRRPVLLRGDLCFLHSRASDEVRSAQHVFYQKGYAPKLLNSIGFGFNVQKVVFQNQNFKTGLGLSFEFANIGLRSRFRIAEYDSVLKTSNIVDLTEIRQPAASISTTVFAFLQCKLSTHIQLISTAGLGLLLNKYSPIGTVVENGTLIYHSTFGGSSQIEPVGFTSPPPISAGIIVTLPRKQKN